MKLEIYIFFINSSKVSYGSLEELTTIINNEFEESFNLEDIKNHFNNQFERENEVESKQIEYYANTY